MFGPSPLSSRYNATTDTLSWGYGNKTLSTGLSGMRCYLAPMSIGLSRTAFGASSTWQAHADFTSGVRAGDFLLVNEWSGIVYSPPRRFKIDGVQEWPHDILPHIVMALSEHRQS